MPKQQLINLQTGYGDGVGYGNGDGYGYGSGDDLIITAFLADKKIGGS